MAATQGDDTKALPGGTLDGERAGAYAVPEAGVDLTAKQVLDCCRGRIAAYKIPDEVHSLPQLPTSALGKVQKYKLRQMALEEVKQLSK